MTTNKETNSTEHNDWSWYGWGQNVKDNKQRNTKNIEHNDWSWYGCGKKCKGQQMKKHNTY